MSIKTYKILLWGLALAWATVSFAFFGHQLLNKTTFNEAKTSVTLTQSFFEEYSKQIKFKLGQWSYNYQLKSNKGVEFDHAAFMEAEFDLIGFYSITDDESAPYEKQWLKSKDFASNELSENIVTRMQTLSYEAVKSSAYVWMAGLDESGQSVVMMASAVNDAAIGTGLLVGVLDLERVPYGRISPDVVVLDSEGRFILHPRKEYMAQKASSVIKTIPEGELYAHEGEAWLHHRQNGYDYVFRAEQKSLVGMAVWPLILMLLGLGFLVALPMLLQEEPEAFEDVKAFEPKTAEQSEIDFAGYESVLKVQNLRDKLNKMSLISSSLKGRLDLVSLGEIDQKLLKDIVTDFNTLDHVIDEAFNEASEFNTQDEPQAESTSLVMSGLPTMPSLETQNLEPEVKTTASSMPTKQVAPEAAKASGTTIKAETFAFEIEEADIDVDFAQSLSLTPVVEDAEQDSNTTKSSLGDAVEVQSTEKVVKATVQSAVSRVGEVTSVVKTPAGQYGSTLVSESLEEAKSAFGSFADDLEGDVEDLFGDLNDLEEIEVVVAEETEREFKPVSSKNDWTKVIEELTEELNNLDLDMSDMEMDQADEDLKNELKANEEIGAIKPPRVEL